MMSVLALVPVYALPLGLAVAGWAAHHARRTRRNRMTLARNRAAGLAEPPGIHPLIDPSRCIGCGACVRACPESDVLGMVGRLATLIEPWACIGHGVCRDACPTGAISLIFGTATRGIEMPVLHAGGETSVAGIHIAGELGGPGLIRDAINQGRAAIDHIAAALAGPPADPAMLDVVIVGCGPAGIAAALGAKAQGLRFVLIDQATLGGSVAHYPRGKLVMTSAVQLPLIGEVRLGAIAKEQLLTFWQDVIAQTGLAPQFEERVLTIAPTDGGWMVTSDAGQYPARRVLLAMGRGGTPRRLGTAGEELGKVVYRLTDAGQYAHQRVAIIGGGDSALEAASMLADVAGTHVTLIHRGPDFARASAANREAFAARAQSGRIVTHLRSQPTMITATTLTLTSADRAETTIANDAVIICAGGTLPREWLAQIGIATRMHHGQSVG